MEWRVDSLPIRLKTYLKIDTTLKVGNVVWFGKIFPRQNKKRVIVCLVDQKSLAVTVRVFNFPCLSSSM